VLACHGELFLTYRGLDSASGQLAEVLKQKGVCAGSCAAVLMERSIEMVVAVFAVLKAGGAYVPIDAAYPRHRVDYILEDSSARVLLTELSELSKVSDGIEVVVPGKVSKEFLTRVPYASHAAHPELAYVMYTSGSTGSPKGVMIRQEGVVNILWALFRLYPLLLYLMCRLANCSAGLWGVAV
jgi:iturin family lipopeptide synthetase C